MITGVSLEDSKEALELAETRGTDSSDTHVWWNKVRVKGKKWLLADLFNPLLPFTDEFYCTVGCHPTHCSDFEQKGESQYFSGLRELAAAHRGKVVAIGECGLGVLLVIVVHLRGDTHM